MYFLTQNIAVDVVKGGRIQDNIVRLAARAVPQEDELDNLGKWISEMFLTMTRLCPFWSNEFNTNQT